MNVKREGGQKRSAGFGWGLAIVIGTSLAVTSCSKKNDAAASASTSGSVAASPPAVPHLPTPYAEVRLGMSEADLKKLFPPAEDITKCAPKLIGGDTPTPTLVPGAEKKARAQCARALDVAGPTLAERKKLAVAAAELTSSGDPLDMTDALLFTTAQVRGVVRAGGVLEAAVVEAARGKSSTAYGAVLPVVGELVDGAFTFARSKQTRRPLCAVIAESCDDLDPERVRTYVQGGYSLGQIDTDAHSRVVYGKCRNPFLQSEKTLQNKLVKRAGFLGGIGLARATQSDHKLKPDVPASYTVYSSRSRLDGTTAKLGVQIANAIPDAESYWQGAVALIPGEGASPDWGNAIVWMRDGHVVRVLVNVLSDDKLGDLPVALATVYGAPGSTQGTVTTWSLQSGITAKLDIGAAVALTLIDRPEPKTEAPVLADAGAPAEASAPTSSRAEAPPAATAASKGAVVPSPTAQPEHAAENRAPARVSTPSSARELAALPPLPPAALPPLSPAAPPSPPAGGTPCGCKAGDLACAMNCSKKK